MKKTVLIVSAVFPPEPVVSANLSYDLANKVHQSGKTVIVISPRPSRPLNYAFPIVEASLPFDHIVLDSFVCPQSKLFGRFRESISFGKATYNYIQQHQNEISVIYANTWPLFAQFFLAKAAKRFTIPFFIHVQDIYPESYCHKIPKSLGVFLYRALVPIDRFVLNNAKGVFAISPAMKLHLSRSRGINESKILLARNWQDDDVFVDAYKPLEGGHDTIRVMYLGSINPTANVSLIIHAFAHLNQKDYSLFIVGDGPDKPHCEDLCKQIGIRVSFDTVTPDEVAKKQSQADLLVLCLKKGVAQTATPSKLTSYMLSGRPIVASVDLDSDCANIIRKAGCGLVVEPENEKELCDAITEIAGKSNYELNQLGRAAFEYAKDHLSREHNLKIIVDQLIND